MNRLFLFGSRALYSVIVYVVLCVCVRVFVCVILNRSSIYIWTGMGTDNKKFNWF